MKLFLSSMHPSNRQALLTLLGDPKQPSVAIVTTGWNTYPAERKAAELAKIELIFYDYGFIISGLDLAAASKDTVMEALKDKTLVWVMAGNTFYLNFHMRRSGFSEVIKELLTQGLVYGGESAGAVVAGATLHGVEYVDDQKEAPAIVWDGLSLIDHGVIPHWGWSKYAEPLAAAKTEMEKSTEVITLTNNQALIVVGSHTEIIDNPSSEA